MDIVIIVLDLMHVHNFHCRLINGVKNFAILGAGNSLSKHTDYKTKDIQVLVEGLTDGLDNAAITGEGKYSFNVSNKKKIVFSLHQNAANNYLHANVVKMYKFIAEDLEIKPNSLCFGSISIEYRTKRKTCLNRTLHRIP